MSDELANGGTCILQPGCIPSEALVRVIGEARLAVKCGIGFENHRMPRR